MQTSRTLATTGRICLVFASIASAVMPGIVTGAWVTKEGLDRGDTQVITVNAFTADQAVLKAFRERAEGNTFSSVPIYDALTEEQRAELRASNPTATWAEWMPYQVGQAQKTDTLTPRLQALEDALASLMADASDRFGHFGSRVDLFDTNLRSQSADISSLKASMAELRVGGSNNPHPESPAALAQLDPVYVERLKRLLENPAAFLNDPESCQVHVTKTS